MAASILLYLLKANAVLLLFVAAYYGLLRRLTFFSLNRAYLLFALGFAAVYPAVPVPALLPAEAVAPVAFVVLDAAGAGAPATAAPAAPAVDWAALGLAVYAAGTALLLLRLLVQLLSLTRLRGQSRPAVIDGQAVRVLPGPVSPFSFGRSIYLNPAQHPAPELAAVLRHELVHVRQAHTLDVLLAQLALAAAWCNPAAWLLRRALLDNLEYLADHAVLQTGLDRRAYQYSLLRLSHAAQGPSLVSHFTFPTLKNRVVMMNLPLSSSGKLARYIVAGPLVLTIALGISGARAQGAGPVAPAAKAIPTQVSSAISRPGKGPATTAVADQEPAAVATHTKVAVTTKAVDPADHQLPDGIKAYIAAAYPGSKLVGWAIVDEARDKTAQMKYYASIVESSGEKRKLHFNARQQLVAAPVPKEPGSNLALAQAQKYVDGQPYAGDLNGIDPNTIANITVFKGDRAGQLFGESATRGVVVITTTANQNRADVRAFNERLAAKPAAESAPAAASAAAAGVPYLAAAALAYITKNYPDARLLGVREVKATDGGASRYQAEVAIGRRPGYLLFDEQGQFISESFTSYLK